MKQASFSYNARFGPHIEPELGPVRVERNSLQNDRPDRRACGAMNNLVAYEAMIDLHSHTTASDGQFSPDEQVRLAHKAGVTVLAVTDHDTVDAIAEATATAGQLNMRLVAGTELSAHVHGREVHVLGHFVDASHPALARYSVRLRGERESRMLDMVQKLNRLGIPVTAEQIKTLAHGSAITRPHVARALVDLRICTSVKEAFSRFLGDGKPAFVPKFELKVAQAIELIHETGGTATLAHPGSSKVSHYELERFVASGLDGLEVFHSDHPPSQRDLFLKWCQEFKLVPTAGSDFHGPNVAPDRKFGTADMNKDDFAKLENRASKVS
jgi:3',5'-nucleoside bisphosphate phosphatase